jgi:hypothetical protein
MDMTRWRVVMRPPNYPCLEVLELHASSERFARDGVARWRPEWTVVAVQRLAEPGTAA